MENPAVERLAAAASLAALSALATPKSLTSACRSSISTFSGLMSRWMTPALWARASASAISLIRRTASGIGSAPSWSIRSRSVSPATYGMT